MSARPPDFDDLVGSDLEASERTRLERVHQALIEAGPPPELPPRLSAPPADNVVPLARRRRGVLALLAAAVAAVALALGFFALGFLVADGGGPSTDRVIALSGAGGANASLVVYEIDDAGNWPMQLEVKGLEPAPDGGRYELWLTKGGKLAALCGTFLVETEGTTVVPMNAPWRFDEFDGWVVVQQDSEIPVLTT